MKRRQCDRETTATAFNSSQTFRESEEEFENFGANSSENIIFNNLAKTPPKIDKNKKIEKSQILNKGDGAE